MYAADLDLATDAYGHAQDADGYAQSEDLSAKNTAGIVLAAAGFGLMGLIKIAQHGHDMDEQAEQVATRYDSVSPDQAEYVMRKVAGSFAIDNDPAELAQQTHKIIGQATGHGYSGNQLTFLLDYCADKGMEVDDAITYMTGDQATDILHTVYTETAPQTILDAVKSASKVGSAEEAQAFADQMTEKLIADGYTRTPEEMARFIKGIGDAADTKATATELIAAYSTLSGAAEQADVGFDEVLTVLDQIDYSEDCSGDTVPNLAEGTARLLTTAKQYGIATDDITATIKSLDYHADTSETAEELMSGTQRILEARGEHGASHDQAITFVKKLDYYADKSTKADELGEGAAKLIEACDTYDVTHDQAITLFQKLDYYADKSTRAYELADGAIKLIESCDKYDVSHDQAIKLFQKLDYWADSSTKAHELADGTVKVIEACDKYDVSQDDALTLFKKLDYYSDDSSKASELGEGTARLIAGMSQHKTSLDTVLGLIKDADRAASGQDAIEVADETIRRMTGAQ